VAKINPLEFVREVREEASKVTWPTRRETMISTVMVLIMVALASAFLFLVDFALHKGVNAILGL
jgi:preprotein translocase subunit SecE